jgi:hypothetical protein
MRAIAPAAGGRANHTATSLRCAGRAKQTKQKWPPIEIPLTHLATRLRSNFASRRFGRNSSKGSIYMKSIHVEVTPQLIESVASVIQGNCGAVSELLAGFIAEDVIEYLVICSASERGAADQEIDNTSTQWRINKMNESQAGLSTLLVDILANRRDSA